MNFCPICNTHCDFEEFRGRKREQCPNCHSLVRMRAAYLHILQSGFATRIALGEPVRVAHFAPEPSLFAALSDGGKNAGYECYDAEPRRYGFAGKFIKPCDLCSPGDALGKATYDLIVHNHVLEHLPCDVEAVILRLNACLKPGGLHVFTVPMRGTPYDEDLSESLSPEERVRRFAQEDHMRIFSSRTTEGWLKGLLGREEVAARLHTFLTLEMAELFGVDEVLRNDAQGKCYGNTVFFFKL